MPPSVSADWLTFCSQIDSPLLIFSITLSIKAPHCSQSHSSCSELILSTYLPLSSWIVSHCLGLIEIIQRLPGHTLQRSYSFLWINTHVSLGNCVVSVKFRPSISNFGALWLRSKALALNHSQRRELKWRLQERKPRGYSRSPGAWRTANVLGNNTLWWLCLHKSWRELNRRTLNFQ